MDKYAQNQGWDFGLSSLITEVPYTKEAATKNASEAYEFACGVPPNKDKTTIVVIAMGTTDSYGPNRNADGFSRRMLQKYHPTFERFGHVFANHQNKDPQKSYGNILKSFFNDSMDRTELVLSLMNDRAAKFIQRIHENKPLPVSMGITIPYDVCNICGHKSPTTRQWCKHMQRRGDFGPNSMYYVDDDPLHEYPNKDGNLIFVHNPSGKFFDISIVTKPADQTAYMIYGPRGIESSESSKIAEYKDVADYSPNFYQSKTASEVSSQGSKAAKMVKKVEGMGMALKPFKEDPKFLNAQQSSSLASKPLEKVPELVKKANLNLSFTDVYSVCHQNLYSRAPEPVILKLASANQGAFLEFLDNNPAVKVALRKLYRTGTSSGDSLEDARMVRGLKSAHYSEIYSSAPPVNYSGGTSKEAAFCGLVAADVFNECSPTLEGICRGAAYGENKLARYAGYSSRIEIAPYENASWYLNRAINDFANIIF